MGSAPGPPAGSGPFAVMAGRDRRMGNLEIALGPGYIGLRDKPFYRLEALQALSRLKAAKR